MHPPFFQENSRRRIRMGEKVQIGPLALPVGKEVLKPVTKLETGPNGERVLNMGSRGLMLNVITPLQKFSKGGATISDVLKQRFQGSISRNLIPADKFSGKVIFCEKIFVQKEQTTVRLIISY
jgi:hypothetical protein